MPISATTAPVRARRAGRLAGCFAVILAATLAPVPPALAENHGLGGLLGGIISNLGQVIENKDALLGNVSEAQEREMGRAATAVLLGAAPAVRDTSVQAYVNQVGRWLSLHTERPDLDWRFAVLDDETFNAFATPGGAVLITRGLFLVLRDETELAGVLAHEIAHVIARHHVDAMVAKSRMNLLADIAADAAGVKGALSEALVSASKGIYSSGLDQSDEIEADRMGAVIAARGGYNPFGLYHVLQTLEAAGNDSEMLGLFLSTHPTPGARIKALDTVLPDRFDELGQRPAPGGFTSARARLAR